MFILMICKNKQKKITIIIKIRFKKCKNNNLKIYKYNKSKLVKIIKKKYYKFKKK